ncbi:MAG: hypothetical protein KAU62_18020 [Candidatus Heimdallarchaeota archaeon]|nr:hypothetical protein [Candidatus Heimdallarchaeota archaeon]MCK4613059.1 hypothetical protein [Candidatus Heimdallarchaeota archaeon]
MKSQKQKTIGTLLLFFTILILISSSNFVQTNSNEEYLYPTFLADEMLIRSHHTTVDIYQTDSISVSESFVVENTENTTQTYIDLWFNTSLNTLIVEDGEGSLIFNWDVVSNSSNKVRVNFRTELNESQTAAFAVKYDLNTILNPIGSKPIYYSFEFSSTISHQTTSYGMIVLLPERSFIHEFEDSTPSIYPINATQILEKNRIKVTWNLDNLAIESNPFFLIRFDEPLVPEEDLSFWESKATMFLVGFAVGVLIGISGISWLIRYREKKAMKKIGMTLLTDNQKSLIKIIYDKKGKVSQKDLCDITGYSKSKISRNLVPLELRGLIKREKWGRTYVIYLTDDGRTVIE